MRCLVILALLPLCVSAEEPAAGGLASMTWLAGSWTGPTESGEFRAYYSTPEGGKILSYSEWRRGQEVGVHEFEKFETVGDAVVLTPYPGGRRAASFRLAELTEDRAVFENPKKDFPTRIAYHRAAPDRLVIELSDPHGESDRVQTFDLKRG